MKKLKIVYEDKHILIVEKDSGVLTISTEKEKYNTLYHEVYEYIKKKNQKIFIVHRLDKDTSGLVLFAKSEKVKEYFQDHWSDVIRKYYAITYGNKMPDKGEIKVNLSETSTLKTYVNPNGKLAITKYTKLLEKGKYNLIDVEILTGRKNQIRVSLTYIGYPIVGDKKYGTAPNPLRRLCLHAYMLDFVHPITHEHMRFELNIPKVFDVLIK